MKTFSFKIEPKINVNIEIESIEDEQIKNMDEKKQKLEIFLQVKNETVVSGSKEYTLTADQSLCGENGDFIILITIRNPNRNLKLFLIVF